MGGRQGRVRRSSRSTAVLLAAVLGILVCGAPVSAAGQDDELGSRVEHFADEFDVPGVAVEIVDRDGVVDRAVTGDDGNGRPVDESTPFVWGSVSKSFTALVVSRLAAEGRLDLAAPVVTLLPELDSVLDPGTTVDDLVHHTSGLPHDLGTTDDWDRRDEAVDALDAVRDLPLGEPGKFRYSSVNYLLLQAVVEKVTGEPYEVSLHREVTDPAGAEGVIADADTFEAQVPPGHVPFFTAPKKIDTGVDTAGFGYGYLAGSVDDLGRYASLQLADLASPAVDAQQRRNDVVDTGHGTEYGYGWYVEQMSADEGATTEVRWHSGAVPGYFTHVALIPERDIAVVLVANSYGEMEADALAGAAREVVRSQLGPTAGADSGIGFYEGMLAGLVLFAVGLLVWITRIVLSLVRRDLHTRQTRGVVLRVVLAAVVGGVLLFAGLLGVPALVGAPVQVVSLWAPDVALLFWVILGEVFLVSALLVLRAVLEHERFAGSLGARSTA